MKDPGDNDGAPVLVPRRFLINVVVEPGHRRVRRSDIQRSEHRSIGEILIAWSGSQKSELLKITRPLGTIKIALGIELEVMFGRIILPAVQRFERAILRVELVQAAP